jgi:hypothetical protein
MVCGTCSFFCAEAVPKRNQTGDKTTSLARGVAETLPSATFIGNS